MQKNNIALQFATLIEAKPFLELSKSYLLENNPIKIYKINDIILAISGIGSIKSAIASTYIITKYNIHSIVNIGAAGLLSNTIQIGKIYSIKKLVDNTKISINPHKPKIYDITPLKNFNCATCLTNNSPLHTSNERQKLSHLADMVDMELTGIVTVTNLFNVNCFSIKYTTDDLNHTNHKEIVKNIRYFSQLHAKYIWSSLQDIFNI